MRLPSWLPTGSKTPTSTGSPDYADRSQSEPLQVRHQELQDQTVLVDLNYIKNISLDQCVNQLYAEQGGKVRLNVFRAWIQRALSVITATVQPNPEYLMWCVLQCARVLRASLTHRWLHCPQEARRDGIFWRYDPQWECPDPVAERVCKRVPVPLWQSPAYVHS